MVRRKKHSNFTFLIVPDAHSNVMRFRISIYTIYAVAFTVLAVVITAAILFFLRIDQLRLAEETQIKLSQSASTVIEQDKMIAELQNQVISLAAETENFRTRLEEMEALEQSIKVISGIEGEGIDGNAYPSAAEAYPNDARKLGLGGSYNAVSNDEIVKLSQETKVMLALLDDQMAHLKDSLTIVKKQVEERQHELDMTPTIWPTDSRKITSTFGYRKDPFNSRAAFHSGLDISADLNSPVYSTADGVVHYIGNDRSPGKNIIINHGNGIQTRYMHLNDILVEEGEQVKKGQKIALSGNTGRSTGPHVHYEVIKDGVAVDPKLYLE